MRLPNHALSARPENLLATVGQNERYRKQKPDVYHVVRRGDTLSRIATYYEVNVNELVALNNLRSRHRIRVGQRIRLPVADGSVNNVVASRKFVKPQALPKTGVYVVRNGDSIDRIARKFGVSEAELIAANGIRNSHQSSEKGEKWYRQKIQNRQALQQHDAIVKRLSSIQGVMPNKIKEKFDTHMRGIYSLIRQHRNEAGHPTGVSKSRDETLPLFYLFVSQLKLVYELMQWLDEDKRL